MREGSLIANRYELSAPLGRGNMAEVWDGYDQILDRRVAVKFIRRTGLPDDVDYDRIVKRFAREARVTARLEHPGVPTVYDLGSHQGETYLAMQLVAGHTLGDVIAEQGPLPAPWAAAIGAQICSVLAAAHEAALVHRDLKPRNLMLCPDGSVKVLDFGIAAVLDAVEPAKLTTTGHPPGTPSYMAPEQVAGGEVGPAADLYALGCVLYELLAGAPPFGADHLFAVLHKHVHDEPPALQSLRPDLPPALVELVRGLLAKQPAQRPGDAAEVYHRLFPHAAAATGDGAAGGELGPTRPYHYPFGPLPLRQRRGGGPPVPSPRSAPAPAAAPEPAGAPPAATASQAATEHLNRHRLRAVSLVDEGQVTQAGEVLAGAITAAAPALGTTTRRSWTRG